ncbi:MAG: helicase-related protein [Verrucomicrobiota bacterium]
MRTTAKELPMQDVRRTDVPKPDSVPSGLDAFADRCIGRWKSRQIHSNQLWNRAGELEVIYRESYQSLPPDQLRRELNVLHRDLRQLGNRWSDGFDKALPLIVAAAKQTLGIEPYRTQIMGALALSRSALTEMATGEGKTLTISLAAVAAGWSGRPVHIITANDYLASRDAKNLQHLYEFCGLKAASITSDMGAVERRQAYRASVVYCTGKELVADFLRDRILLGDHAYAPLRNIGRLRGAIHQTPTVLRGIHTAFVDEADNQLIDEAVTPLIISQPDEGKHIEEVTLAAHSLATTLSPDEHYEIDERKKEIELSDEGRRSVRLWTESKEGLLSAPAWMGDLVVTALQARHFFIEGKQYVILDNKIVIVDEFTGRQMPGRSWRLGLHQAVEAKEGLKISMPSETLARLSFQRFYRLFRHLSGITGTARESAQEFWRIYRLPLIVVPRHKPNQRKDAPLLIFKTEEAKVDALLDEVLTVREAGRPILLGTRSVSVSEQIAQLLERRGIDCQVLNAARDANEASIIAMAGGEGRVTIATNMAGRGTDILIDRRVAEAGGLHVIVSELHESRRVDRQLMGRAGRQGDPGSTLRLASMDDEVVRRSLPKWFLAMLMRAGLFKFAFFMAQRRAERSGQNRRMIVLDTDVKMGKQLMNRSLDRI